MTFDVDILEFLSAYFGVLVQILAILSAYWHSYFTVHKRVTVRNLVIT
jgi:hypothetical protein